jgi:hypothetical protein
MTDSTAQNGLLGSVVNWFAHPWNSEGSAFNWLLFVGLLLVAAWFWNHVLLTITEDI